MSDASDVFGELPAGHAAVSVLPGQEAAPLRVCALFRTEAADPVAGRFFLLRERWDARVYLGAITDAAGRVHRWIEIWVQTVDAPPVSMTARGQAFTNVSLNETWAREADALDASGAHGIVRTGFEQHAPAPVFIDAAGLPQRPMIGTEPLSLCEDDAALIAAGLPAYSSSIERYLFVPSQAAASPFVPVTANAPKTSSTVSLADVVGKQQWSPFNPSGGRLIVRGHDPLGFEQFMSILEVGDPGVGTAFADALGIPELRRPVELTAQSHDDGRLLMARQGRAGQWIETFYLKLCAWAGAADAVYRAISKMQRPLLNLSPESFRVSLGNSKRGLPSLWHHEVSLCDPGDALPLKVENAERVYFVRELGSGGESAPVYRPAVASSASFGVGVLRIRLVMNEARGTVVEGTFTPRDRLNASRNDLLRLRVGLAAGRVDLYAQLQPDQALAGTEWRLRTIPQSISAELAQQLKAAEGVSLGTVEYEHVPLLSTPADAYALAVLLLRTLVVRPTNPLATAVDEAWSLAREAAAGYDPSVPLSIRIGDIFSRDERWAERLGSQFAAGSAATSPAGAPSPLPRTLWWDTLALIVALLPGAGPDSFFTDYGDAPPNALHRAFEPVLAAIDALLARVRSVLVVDWRFNEELGGVVRTLLRAFTPAAPKPATPPPPVQTRPAVATPAATFRRSAQR